MSDENPKPLVSAVDVHKRFGDMPVLRGVNLQVQAGEILCIIGPSGSGKSTFLRCINQLETYQSGRIYVGGELIGYKEAGGRLQAISNRQVVLQRRRIGMVFQQFNLFWHMTVKENIIEAPIRVLGQSPAQASENAMRLLERVGLAAKADAYPMKLSGGQQQRAAVGDLRAGLYRHDHDHRHARNGLRAPDRGSGGADGGGADPTRGPA